MERSIYPLHNVGSAVVSVQVVDGPFGSDLKVGDYRESGVPLIRVSNCRTGRIVPDDELVFISAEKHAELIRSEVLPGDVLLTKAGHILGYTAVFPDSLGRGNITSHLASIRPSSEVDSQYLAEFLTGTLGITQIYRWGNKSTRPELNTDEVRGLQVIVPPLDEQRELVAAMEAARETRRAKLAEADALLAGLDAYLLETLGLVLPPADDRHVFAMTTGAVRDQSRLAADYFHPERILAIRAMQDAAARMPCAKLSDIVAFVRDQIKTPGPNYLGLAGVQSQTGELSGVAEDVEGTCFEFQADDVLFARLRPYLNKVWCADAAGCCSPEFHVLRVNNPASLQPEFLAAALRSSLILAQTRHMMTGNTHPRLANEDVADLIVPVPDVATQESIAAEIRRRRERSRALREEAETGWAEAKRWFEEQLLEPAS